MSLRLHNTLSRQTEPFVPIEPGHVRMYVCGITVYDLCHVGHARMMIAFDVLQRWLKASGLRVTYVRNVTDVDDKINARAAELAVDAHITAARNVALEHIKNSNDETGDAVYRGEGRPFTFVSQSLSAK